MEKIHAEKIKYRLTFNYGNRLNIQGRSSVALECRQGTKRIYISSRVMITPSQWDHGRIVNHQNAEKLTVWLIRWMNSIEEVELDAMLHGHQMTLLQLKEAVKSGTRANATLGDFVGAVIDNDSSRCKTTKQSYHYLVNDMEREYGSLTVSDITYDLVIRYRESMRRKELSENTVKGRLKALRCLMEQARLRKLIDDNPFDNITIGNISGRKGGLTKSEVRRLERLELTGREEKVRDLFLLGCYTGLRWGDLSTIEEADISNGILQKTMHKTNHDVIIPIGAIFYGKAQTILDKYPDITALSHCCCNTTANRIIKEVAEKANIRKRCYFHLARKTFSQMLNMLGMERADITTLMGHRDQRTTLEHYIFNDTERVKKTVKKLFK